MAYIKQDKREAMVKAVIKAVDATVAALKEDGIDTTPAIVVGNIALMANGVIQQRIDKE